MSNQYDEAEYKFRHDPDGLANHYQSILQTDPDNEILFCRLMQHFSQYGYHTRVRDLSKGFLERNPHSRGVWMTLGGACHTLGDEEGWQHAYARANECDPGSQL